MKILLLLCLIALSCNNESAQKKAYQDSAYMWADSLEKYKPGILPDSNDIYRRNMYKMAKIMYDYYEDKINELNK